MRSIIDRDIARLEERIRTLKSRRNGLSPISRLPPEILCNIFSLIEDVFSSNRSPKFWTNFSQVSHHWRSTALSAPELWTKIPVNLPCRWIQERLIRSKMAKLTIRSGPSFLASIPKTTTIEAVRSCLYRMNRIEELQLTANAKTLEKIFRDLPKSAPQLHTLCIGGATTFSVHEDFLHDAERLRRVELTNCKISLESRLLTGLTRLSLQDSLKANSGSSIIQLLNALQRMPALTNLYLINSIPGDSKGSSTYPVVDLPCLRKLHISSGVGALTTFLCHITVPHSTILVLTCKENQSAQIDFSNFLSVLATKFLSSLVIKRIGLQLNKFCGLEFYIWTTAVFQCQLQVVLTWPMPYPQNHVKALTCAFNAMRLPFLTQLHISTMHYIDSQTWVNTFGKLPLLKRVRVNGSALHSFLRALVHKTMAAEKSKKAYYNPSFPNLRYIDLIGCDFSGTGSRSASVDMLLDCLMERCERRAVVRELDLKDCYYISSDDVERFEEVVDVIWDGIEQEFSEDEDEEEEDEEEKDYDSDGNTIYSDEFEYFHDPYLW